MTTSSNVKKQNIWKDSGVDGDAQKISQLSWMFSLKIIEKNCRSPIPADLQWQKWATSPESDTGNRLLKFINNQIFPGHNSVLIV